MNKPTSTLACEFKIAVLIVAAGVGSRCYTQIPKQYIKIAGQPVLFHAVKKFLDNQYINCIKVVINKNHENFYSDTISSITNAKLLSCAYGGESRKSSVKLGLEALKEINPDFVIIHDACRPFVSSALIDKLIESMISGQYEGVVSAVKIEDTVSIISDHVIESIIPREELRAIQTPQIFEFKELLLYHDQLTQEFTDDSSLMVKQKKQVLTIQGEKSNFKLTTKEDIHMAKFLFEEPKFRVGAGYDVHRFIKPQNRTNCLIKICGVEIEHNMAIEAHSDGDVAIHAVVDAILGALGCGDIGDHFPSNSSEWKDCNSLYFLKFAAEKTKKKGYGVSNLDITIICEEPIISPYKTVMKKFISKTLEISDEFVNIKATTAERLGSLGRKEGIAAHASVMLYPLNLRSEIFY